MINAVMPERSLYHWDTGTGERDEPQQMLTKDNALLTPRFSDLMLFRRLCYLFRIIWF